MLLSRDNFDHKLSILTIFDNLRTFAQTRNFALTVFITPKHTMRGGGEGIFLELARASGFYSLARCEAWIGNMTPP